MAMLDVNDVMEILGYREGKAYEVIRELNKELNDKGYLTRRALVLDSYFYYRYGLNADVEDWKETTNK